MKNILVPTDFSQNATDAAHYAAAIATITGARLLLFHAYHVSVVLAEAQEPLVDLDLENFENLNQTQIDKLAYELHLTYGISVTRIMRPGFATDEIPAIAKRLNADLVVMGRRGKNQAAGSSLGQITAVIIQESKVPVLCVPAGLTFKPFVSYKYNNQRADSSLPIPPTISQKLETLFGSVVTAAPNAISTINTTPRTSATALTQAFPAFDNSTAYHSEFGNMLAMATEPLIPAGPSLLIINADKNTCRQIAVNHFLADDASGLWQSPILVLPEAL